MKAGWMCLVSLNLIVILFDLSAHHWHWAVSATTPCEALKQLSSKEKLPMLQQVEPTAAHLPAHTVAATGNTSSQPPSSTETAPLTTASSSVPAAVPRAPETESLDVARSSLAAEAKREAKRCHFRVDPCVELTAAAAAAFDQIYARNSWGSRAGELGTHTRSGLGSDMKGAFDWVVGLSKFFVEHPELQTIADIPSGDMGWQMAVRHLNTAKLYFGGDIAKSVALDNAKRYSAHENKVLQHWDLYSCGAPQWYTSCDALQKNSFDVIMIRDALQHIDINKVQEILRKVILKSGAKWFITSSYPGDGAVCKNEKVWCHKGAMRKGDGGWFPIALDCAPFNFPPPHSKTASHKTFPIENDFMHVYKIDDALKEAVLKMKPCSLDSHSQPPADGSPAPRATVPALRTAQSSRFRHPGLNR